MIELPLTDRSALVLALSLAITADDDDRANQCIEIADQLAARLTPAEVAAAQDEVIRALDGLPTCIVTCEGFTGPVGPVRLTPPVIEREAPDAHHTGT